MTEAIERKGRLDYSFAWNLELFYEAMEVFDKN